MMKRFKDMLIEFTEMGFLLIALGVVAGILTGDKVPFVGDVVGNITSLVKSLGDNGLVGLVSLGFIGWVFSKK